MVVIGGGFGGLNAIRELDGADADVTVVDRTNHHLFQPLLYQVAAGILPPGLIAPALRSIIKKQANAHALLAEVMSIDLGKKEVRTEAPDGRTLMLGYDTLVVAAGATHSYFGRDEFAEFAPGMKTIEDARYLRDRILSAFELAELSTDPAERAELLTFVVIGAGPTGVETVGQIAELAHTVLPRDYRSINTREARIILLEGAPAVLPPFDKKLQAYTHRQLEKMGVEIHLNSLAVGMDDDSVTVKGPDGVETIRCRTRIWAAGVAASPLAKMLAEQAGAETDRAGRVPVNPDCTLPGHPEVFAIGDMVSLNKLPGRGAACAAGGPLRRQGDQGAAGRGARAPAVQVLRQGLDGDHRLPVRRGRRVRGQGHRRARLPHVGVHPRDVPGRVGQPARHDVHVGAGAGVHQEPRAPDHHLRAGALAGRAPRPAGAAGGRAGDAARDRDSAVGPAAAR